MYMANGRDVMDGYDTGGVRGFSVVWEGRCGSSLGRCMNRSISGER